MIEYLLMGATVVVALLSTLFGFEKTKRKKAEQKAIDNEQRAVNAEWEVGVQKNIVKVEKERNQRDAKIDSESRGPRTDLGGDGMYND